jgi:16S rRNA (guanine966-N2)-methyltransferase
LRLTGGEARGRRLRSPRGSKIRPTADRVREALFDILGPRIHGASFLDACAGTGAVGCEALSRGAARVVFLERDRAALKLIAENLEVGDFTPRSEVVTGDVRATLRKLEAGGERFRIVFLDPPYEEPAVADLLSLAARCLSPGGSLILEHSASRTIEAPPGLHPHRTYRYGDTALLVCRAPGDLPAT